MLFRSLGSVKFLVTLAPTNMEVHRPQRKSDFFLLSRDPLCALPCGGSKARTPCQHPNPHRLKWVVNSPTPTWDLISLDTLVAGYLFHPRVLTFRPGVNSAWRRASIAPPSAWDAMTPAARTLLTEAFCNSVGSSLKARNARSLVWFLGYPFPFS